MSRRRLESTIATGTHTLLFATVDSLPASPTPAPPAAVVGESYRGRGHRGAAAGDVATGVHMPLYTTALALAPDDQAPELVGRCSGSSNVLLMITVDLGWLLKTETNELMDAIATSSGVDPSHLLLQLSHTHAGPSLTRPFVDPECPGGALAMEWWSMLKASAAAAATEAVASLQPVWLSSALGKCNLAQKRDLYDLDVQASTAHPWSCRRLSLVHHTMF